MKKVKLEGIQVALFNSALLKSLFPKPDSGEILHPEFDGGEITYFYFDDNYHQRLAEEIKRHYEKGAFARSNSEQDWLGLMKAINITQDITDKQELIKLQSHFMAK